MQYFVRKELDMGSPINLRKLSPLMKIYAGIISKWRETKYYKTQFNKRKEAAYAMQVKHDECLKDALLALIYKELDDNTSLSAKSEECVSVVLQINSRYIHSIDRVLKGKEFLPYYVERVEEEPDFRLAYPEMPILLKINKRSLQEGVV